jgi:hypothetical protein
VTAKPARVSAGRGGQVYQKTLEMAIFSGNPC